MGSINDDCHVFISFGAKTSVEARILQKFLRDQKYLTVTLSSETKLIVINKHTVV
jgi:hypothetical protein